MHINMNEALNWKILNNHHVIWINTISTRMKRIYITFILNFTEIISHEMIFKTIILSNEKI